MIEINRKHPLFRIYPLPKEVRKEILVGAAKATQQHAIREQSFPLGTKPWTTYDSHLYPGTDSSFHDTFADFLPKGEQSFHGYIERLLVRKRGAAIGIEFGGPGSNLFGDFSQGFFCQTLGVTLADLRTDSVKERDSECHHKVITGNMFSSGTQQKIAEWLSEKKADVIFERMSAGLNLVPQDPRFLSEIAAEWYTMLAEGGVMFVQIPSILVPVMEEWRDFVERNYPGQIQIEQRLRLVHPVLGINASDGVMRLNKQMGAPLSLPLLDPRTVRDLYRSFLLTKIVDKI